VLLVENVIFTVVPVGEIGGVAAALLNWFVHFEDFSMLLLCFFSLCSIMDNFAGGGKFHRMGVNDLGFFLGVESYFMASHIGILKFVAKKFLFVLSE
jgi:hypothetical protein